jgi:nucleoid-associated protein YgaU
MRKMLVLAMMMTLTLMMGCSKDKSAREVRPVPMPPGSSDTGRAYYGNNSATAMTPGSTMQQDQVNPQPMSVEGVQNQTNYVASPDSPYIELPAVSEPGRMQPMSTEPIIQPGEPSFNQAPSTYTFSEQGDTTIPSTPTPSYIQSSTPAPATPVPAAGSAVHVVAKGDTLWRIAKQYYGDGKRWTDIARANNISDPNRIYVGMKLAIPR